MEEILKQILSKLNTLESGQQAIASDVAHLKTQVSDMNKEVSDMNKKISVIFDQTADLTEFTTSTKNSLKRIEEDVNSNEKVLAQNCYEITRLKASM